MEEETLALKIEKALKMAVDDQNTRAMAVVRTKLQEAKMWLSEHNKELMEAARRVGFQPPTPT